MPTEQLRELCNRHIITKRRLSQVQLELDEINMQIAELLPGPEIGSKTNKVNDETSVTITRGYNYKANLDQIKMVLDGTTHFVPIKTKTEIKLDEKGYEWYKDNEPEIFDKICDYVSVTPKKIQVQVKVK